MRTSAVRITAEGQLEPCDVNQALAGVRGDSSTFWISVDDYQSVELDAWIDKLNLTPFTRNRLLQQGKITKVVSVAEGILLDLRVLPAASSTAPRQVAFLGLENLLIQLDPELGPDAGGWDARGREFELMDTSSAGVLLSVLLLEAKRVSQEVRHIRSGVFELDERMDRDPVSVSLHDILELKNRLLTLVAVAEEQLDSFETLTAVGNKRLDASELRETVQLLSSVAGFSERTAERLETRVADLRHRYDAQQQEKLNRRLAVLTVVSAIFLPLTLIAGIWGMNFEKMPELGRPWGYPAALGFMACIAAGMLFFFGRKGWFK